jgi:LytS/YehU family sensor histidine kinase
MDSSGDRGHYIQKVREDTRQYIHDLLTENEKLRLRVAAIEGEKHHLEEEVNILREEVDSQRSQAIHLQQELANVEAENRRFYDQYQQVEQHNANLANLYVASYRLHTTVSRDEVLTTIHEIIINLIGSEELAVFELDPGSSVLRLVSSFGIDDGRYRDLPLGSGVIGKAAASGETYLSHEWSGNGRASDEPEVTSCIPLKVGGQVTGAIAIFRLLQHKKGLEAVDYELFHLLATHASTALFCTRPQA